MATLVECVPNFSEGRDKARVDAIVAAMKMDGVYLLDREMDADHNRCVITLVGDREAIQEAAIRGVGKAAELIDLTKHRGAHPRMGAADVVPFIPIEGVTIEDCVAMARHVVNAGAFYAYISQGLARPLGVGCSWIALVAYNSLQVGLYGFIGAATQPLLAQWFHVDVKWWVIAP